MLVSNFSESCNEYEGFQVWEVADLDAFFKGNQVLAFIFQDKYKMAIEDLAEKRAEIEDTDLQIVNNLLSAVGDKSFFVFALHDMNHMALIKMQHQRIMDFGLNIEDLKGDKVYVLIMDKKLQKMH